MSLSPGMKAALVAGAAAMLMGFTKAKLVIGAWTGAAAFRDAHRVGRRAQELGLTCLDVVVGDQSDGATVPGGLPWSTFGDAAKITAVVQTLRQYVPHVWVTVWAQPRQDVVDGIREVSIAAADGGARGITLDTEEPWTQPMRRNPSTRSQWTTVLVRAARAGGIEVAATPIVYHDRTVLDELLGQVDTIIPQTYSTAKNAAQLPPGELERTTIQRFSPYGKRLVMGAAAWNQAGAYGGMSVSRATETSLRTSLQLGIREVRYWHLATFDAEDIAGIGAALKGV